MKNDKKVSMDELDVVSGGTIIESYHVGFMLQDAGYDVFDNGGTSLNFGKFRQALGNMGVDKIDDHGGLLNQNTYSVGGKTMNNDELIQFLVKNKGCVNQGAEAYLNRWLDSMSKVTK